MTAVRRVSLVFAVALAGSGCATTAEMQEFFAKTRQNIATNMEPAIAKVSAADIEACRQKKLTVGLFGPPRELGRFRPSIPHTCAAMMSGNSILQLAVLGKPVASYAAEYMPTKQRPHLEYAVCTFVLSDDKIERWALLEFTSVPSNNLCVGVQ
jgi:hypothetical protein